MLTVTERFTRWLTLSRLTQTEVARQLGKHRSFITRLKRGTKRPTLVLAVKLEAMTGIPAGAWAAPMRATSSAPRKVRSRKGNVAQEKTAHVAG